MDFKPPTTEETLSAIGRTDGLPLPFQRALNPGKDFEPIPLPGAGDWLAEHFEPGQTFDDFRSGEPNTPDARRNKIYLQPLGEFLMGRSPPLDTLKAYANAYFLMDVKICSPLPIITSRIRTRINPISRNRQILTGDILAFLKQRIPADAFCTLAITMEDLYPHPSWNFVFGQASVSDRIGVFSFARYDPLFYGEEPEREDQELLLKRSCKVLVHETAHMFSLAHCIFFRCVMNGSNHLKESDSRPISLCPVCLRKLQFSIGFDLVDRYRLLLDFYREAGFDHEAQWVSRRLRRIMAVQNGK
jgi:archaemetzincin